MGFTGILSGLLGGVGGAISDTGAALIAFFTTITDGAMWRSLGWLALGTVLILAGLSLLLKGELISSVGPKSMAELNLKG